MCINILHVATRSAPWFNLVPENITKVVKYEDLNLTCAAVGVPFPKVLGQLFGA